MANLLRYLRLYAQARREYTALASSLHGQRRSASNDAGNDAGNDAASSFVPQWVRSRLPAALGGDRETLGELESLTMEKYLDQITAARKLGSISGSAFGAKASDAGTQGFLRNTELVIGAMTPEEREKESLSAGQVAALARKLDLSVDQIIAVMGRYKYTKHMMAVLARRKREGQPMPKTIEEVEELTGNWRSFVASAPLNPAASPGGRNGLVAIPADAVHPSKGGPCGLSGMSIGRSTKCPRFRKSYKACCGKTH